MTPPPDYLAALLDASNPESGSRALLLSNLEAGFPVQRSLALALGIRGALPARAVVALGRARAQDEELRAACERVERAQGEKERSDGEVGQAVSEPGARSPGVPSGDVFQVARASGQPDFDGRLDAGGRGRPTGQEAQAGEGAAAARNADVVLPRDVAAPRSLLELQRQLAAVPRAAPANDPAPPVAPPNPNAPKWARIRAEAERRYGPGLFGLLCYQDDLLAAKGERRMSQWWLGVFAAFFEARLSLLTLCWILALVGRGGGKSTTLERFAIVVALFAERSMPPSERWQWPFISILKKDADRRISEIEKLLNAAYGLDVKVNKSEGKIETEDANGNAIEILCMASTVGAVSGPSTMGGTVDEAGKMRQGGANPDAELIVSLAETSRARDNWFGVRCSSAWLMRGAHHAAVMKGSNVVNFVAVIGPAWIETALAGYAEVAAWEAAQGNAKEAAQIRAWARTLNAWSPNVPTWVANPSIGAVASRVLIETVVRDPEDEEIDNTTFWLRECGSMPLTGDGGFDPLKQLEGLAEMNRALAASVRGEVPVRLAGGDVAPMKLPGMRPGDARYAGDGEGRLWRPAPTGWDKGDVF